VHAEREGERQTAAWVVVEVHPPVGVRVAVQVAPGLVVPELAALVLPAGTHREPPLRALPERKTNRNRERA
jgi:hypothetical protein